MKCLIVILIFPLFAQAHFCKNWGKSTKAGELNHKIINESSGLALSTVYENRLYHHNDSGDGPYFYMTNLEGAETKKIKIKNYKPKDVEDMSYGRCGDNQCLVLADMGDNLSKRKSIKLVFIKEKHGFSKEVEPYKVIKISYPDGSKDAEGFAMHSNGDAYIMTKEYESDAYKKKSFGEMVKMTVKTPFKAMRWLFQIAKPIKIYRLTKKQIDEGGTQVPSYVGSISLESHLPDEPILSKLVTGLDIHPDGDRFLILTYKKVIELPFNFETLEVPKLDTLELGKDFNIMDHSQLPQQEAITYLSGGSSFIYSTEYHKWYGPADLISQACLD